jgi:thioredoxin
MKRLLLALCLLISCTNLLIAQAVSLSPDEFQQGLAAPQVQLLDVRTAKEYQNAHIKNSLQADWVNIDQFKDRVQYLDKNKPVMIYCASGGRSSAAAEWLRNNGYHNVQELKGGLTAWKAGDKPTEGIPATKQITVADYAEIIKTKGRVLVDFGAEWCPPCKKMEPVLMQLENELGDKFSLAKVDAGIHTNIMKELKVEAIPTFIIYQDGKEVWRRQGVVASEELKKQLGK